VSEALLVTGSFGSGKTSVIEEIAEILEGRDVPYAAIDLDWLCWGWSGSDDTSGRRLLTRNLAPVVANYVEVGVIRFLLAGFYGTIEEIEETRQVMDMPMHVVDLEVPWEEVERRLSASPTQGRAVDLRDAIEMRDAGLGVGLADFTVVNHNRPLTEVAEEILERVGWG
jgi:shikimate kinase